MRERLRLALFIIIIGLLSAFLFNPKITGFVTILFDQGNITVSNNSVVISWNTDIESNSTIGYGTTEELGLFETRESFETEHIVLITNLSENTTYFFSITSCDTSGNCTSAGVFNFTTNVLEGAAPESNQTNTSEAASLNYLDENAAENLISNESAENIENESMQNPAENLSEALPVNETGQTLEIPQANLTEAGNEITNVTVEEPKITIEPNEKVSEEVADQIAVKEEIPVIVILEDDSTEDALSGIDYSLINESEPNSEFKLKYDYSTSNSFAGSVTAEGLVKLMNSPDVKEIIFDRKVRISLYYSVPLIRANSVWNMTVNGQNITGLGYSICVLDTGIDYTHPDFGSCTNDSFLSGTCPKVLGGYDFVNNDNNPVDDNIYRHGTHVSSTVAGNGALKGVAPNATIVAVKVCNAGGGCNESDMIAGVEWCTQHKYDYNISVITVSIGGGAYNNETQCVNDDPAFADAINNASAENIFISIASGNDGLDGYISWPACLPNVTSVGAVSKSDEMADFSNIGSLLDILAPGVNICAAKATGFNGSSCFDSYHMLLSGTSMATPHIAGAAVLIQQYYRQLNNLNLTPGEITNVMRVTGKTILTPRSPLAYPRVDVLAAVNLLPFINYTDNSTSNINGKIKFYSQTNFVGAASCLRIYPNLISVDSQLCPNFNKSAELTINNLTFQKTPRILKDGQTCGAECKVISYDSQNLTFNVTSFTNYSAAVSSNLAIWDETDYGMPYGDKTIYPGDKVYFFANYTNSSNGEAISTGACTINATGIVSDMLFNFTKQLFEFNRSYVSSSFYNWDVNCSEPSSEPLNSSDTVVIASLFCDIPINSSTVLSSDLVLCNGTGININNDSLVLDCAGHLISGTNILYGINVSSHNNITIVNCTVQNFGEGIYVQNASDIFFYNNTIKLNNDSGIFILDSNRTNISYNYFYGNGLGYPLASDSYNWTAFDGLYILNSGNNRIANNTFELNHDAGININISGNNLIANNSFLSNYRESSHAINSDHDFYAENLFNDSGWAYAGTTISSNFAVSSVVVEGRNVTFNGNVVQNNKRTNGVYINASGSLSNIKNNLVHDMGDLSDAYPTAYGILVYGAENSTLANNTIYLTDTCALRYIYSDNVSIADNTIFSVPSTGMCLYRLDDSVISGNIESYNSNHISISLSNNLAVRNNSFVKESLGSVLVGSSNNISVYDNIFVNYSTSSAYVGLGCGVNSANSKNVSVFRNDFTGYGTTGIAVCVSSTDPENLSIEIYNNTMNYGAAGVSTGQELSYGMEIYNNNISNSYYGLNFGSSKYVKIYNNKITNSGYWGIRDQFSEDFDIINNSIINSVFGYYSYSSHDVLFANNTVMNAIVGIDVMYPDHLVFDNNIIFNSSLIGIVHEYGGGYVNITNNNLSYNGDGLYGAILFESAYDFNVINNTIAYSNGSGIYFNATQSTIVYGKIANNRIYSNSYRGIFFEGDYLSLPIYDISVESNMIYNNNDSGIFSDAESFSNINITNNLVFNNSNMGVEMYNNMKNVSLRGNNITQNSHSGVFISPDVSADNQIIGNNITNNGVSGSAGIVLINATGLNITGNYIANNSLDGIFALSSSLNITNNTIAYNNRSGIYSVDSSLNPADVLKAANNFTGNLIDKFEIIWFVQAKVYNDTQLANGATVNISGYQNSTPIVTASTNSSGLTSVYNITQYVLTNSDILTNYTPHNFSANYSGLFANKTVVLNLSRIESRLNPVILNLIQGPSNGTVSLSPSEAYDDDTLTASVSGFNGTNLTYAYNFVKNGNSLAVLNMPFDFFATDASGKSLAITLSRVAYNSTGGKIGGAYNFNETPSSMITVANNYLNLSKGTIEAWINPSAIPSVNADIVNKIANYRILIVKYNSTNANLSLFQSNATGVIRYYTNAAITTGWNHIAVTFSNSTKTVSLYINGQLARQNTSLAGFSYSTQNLLIGQNFNGTIDELQIYPYVLSSQQIAAHASLNYNHLASEETSVGDQFRADVLPVSASGLAGDIVSSNTMEILSASTGGNGGGGGGGGASGVFVAKPSVTEEEAAAKEAEISKGAVVEIVNATPSKKPAVEQPAEIEKPAISAQIRKMNVVSWIILLVLLVVLIASVYSYLKHREKR